MYGMALFAHVARKKWIKLTLGTVASIPDVDETEIFTKVL
jgi:hypothetical protein